MYPTCSRIAHSRSESKPLPLRQHDCAVRTARGRRRPVAAPPGVWDGGNEAHGHTGARNVGRAEDVAVAKEVLLCNKRNR